MRDFPFLALQLVVTVAKLVRPAGVHSVIAESLLLKHQLIISRRSSRRAPPLTTLDRFFLGLTMLFVRPRRVAKLAAILKPATLFRFHRALVERKYRWLFSSARTPLKPAAALVAASVIRLAANGPTFARFCGSGGRI